jgi:hypothetical protein
LAKFVEHPVELGKTGKTAAFGNFRNFHVRSQEALLGVADSGHLDIVYQGKTRYPPELAGKIIGADIDPFGQGLQGKFHGIMRVDITGNGINLFGNGIMGKILYVEILPPVSVEQA